MASGKSDQVFRLSFDTIQFEGSLSKFEGQMTTRLRTSAQKQRMADLEAAHLYVPEAVFVKFGKGSL